VAVLLWPESVLPLRTGLAVPLLGANAVHPPSSMVDARFMDAAKAAGLRVNVWRVRDDDDAARLMNLGVDGLIVDDVRATVAVARHR
jgi:glycerophosphoryl diester phosphodiesterase